VNSRPDEVWTALGEQRLPANAEDLIPALTAPAFKDNSAKRYKFDGPRPYLRNAWIRFCTIDHPADAGRSYRKEGSTMSSKDTRTDFDRAERTSHHEFPCPTIATNLKGAYAIPAPSADFDPEKASNEELIKHGIFWRRPHPHENPAIVRAWRRAFSRERMKIERIVPELEVRHGETHLLGRLHKRVTDTSFVTGTWAGAGIRGGGPWGGIVGTWEIPTVSKPSEPQGTEGGWNSSSWVGIDGFNFDITSNDVFQAGVQQSVDAQGNASYVSWFEWYAPQQAGSPSYINQTNFTNLEVNPGNQITCFLALFQMPIIGPLGVILFINETTSTSVMTLLTAPPGATATGNTIEWIMEAPDGGEPKSSLPNFTPVVFTTAVASRGSGAGADYDVGNPQNGDTTNIETADGTILTTVTTGNDTLTIDFIG
jgi:Peptidase A4 family